MTKSSTAELVNTSFSQQWTDFTVYYHEDTVTAVVAGELRFKVDGEWKVCVVGEGFADVTRDFVVIVVDTVERPEDIDIIRAREAKTRAEERLKQKQSRLQYYHTQAALSRAMARLKVTSKYVKK